MRLTIAAISLNNIMEPTTGIEPVNLILTKDVLYLLSYVGTSVYYYDDFAKSYQRAHGVARKSMRLQSDPFICKESESRIFRIPSILERETGFEPATLSLEG